MVLDQLAEVERTIRDSVRGVTGMFRSRFDTSDIVQESLLQVWVTHFRRQPNAQQPGSGGESRRLNAAYLRLVGRGQAFNLQRHHRARRRQAAREVRGEAVQFLLAGDGRPDELVAQREEQLALTRAIAMLPAAEREVVSRRYFDRQTFNAIGAELGLTVDVVRSRLQRAMRLLRRKLGPRMPEA